MQLDIILTNNCLWRERGGKRGGGGREEGRERERERIVSKILEALSGIF